MGDHASRGPTPAGASLPHGLFSYGNMLVPGLIKFGGVSGYPRWAEESPLRQLPAGPAGDNRAFPHHRLSSWPLFHYARLASLPLGLSMMYIPEA